MADATVALTGKALVAEVGQVLPFPVVIQALKNPLFVTTKVEDLVV